jgi:NADPH:quinone reductase
MLQRMSSKLSPGLCVRVSEFAESPVDAIDRVMSLVSQEVPDVTRLGAGDVLIAVRSAAVGWVDLLMSSGQYQHMASPPYTPGLECAGEVVWCGSEAQRTRSVGDAVLVDGLLSGPRSVGAYRQWGGFASYVVAPVEAVIPLPGTLTYDQSAALLGSYETAYHCLVTRGKLQAGETVLIHGATGATGLAAVQVARIVGATVIATGRSREKLEIVASHGAQHVVLSKSEDGAVRPFRDEIKALTHGQGVDVVYDAVGGDISLESLRCVRFGARFLIVGWASTPDVARGKGQRGAPNVNVLPTNLVMMKSLDVLGCPTAISTHHDPSSRAPRLAWANQGLIKPYVSHTFPLQDYKTALRAKWNGEVTGGCVLHPL